MWGRKVQFNMASKAVWVLTFHHLLIVLSRIVGDETSTPTQSIKNGEVFQHLDLDTDHEETDIRIIPHGTLFMLSDRVAWHGLSSSPVTLVLSL